MALYRETYICKSFKIQTYIYTYKFCFLAQAEYVWFFVCPYLTLLHRKYRLQKGANSGSGSGFGFRWVCETPHQPTKKKEKKTGSTRLHPNRDPNSPKSSGIRYFLYVGLKEMKKSPENSTVF